MLPQVTKLHKYRGVTHYAVVAMSLLVPGGLALQQAPHSTPPLLEQIAGDVGASVHSSQHAQERATAPPSSERLENVERTRSGEELLWLARCIYSETKRPIEQLYVGWVVRNRVESQYRGRDSYRAVVLDPHQFSAFNTGTYARQYYSSLTPEVNRAGWQQALRIASYVMNAPPEERPFSILTRHFYSERSMNGSRPPQWSQDLLPVRMEEHQIDGNRFRFFTGVL